MQTRVDGADRNSDLFRDLGARKFFKFKHDQHSATVDIQLIEQRMQEFGTAARDRSGFGRVVMPIVLRLFGWLLATDMRTTSVVGGDAFADPEQPRGEFGRAIERIESSVHHHKDLLQHVWEVRFGDAHAMQIPPHAFGVFVVNLFQLQHVG